MYISRVLLGEQQPQRARRVGPVDDLDLVRADLVVELADRVLDGLLVDMRGRRVDGVAGATLGARRRCEHHRVDVASTGVAADTDAYESDDVHVLELA